MHGLQQTVNELLHLLFCPIGYYLLAEGFAKPWDHTLENCSFLLKSVIIELLNLTLHFNLAVEISGITWRCFWKATTRSSCVS